MHVPNGPFPPTVATVALQFGLMQRERCGLCQERQLHKVKYDDGDRDFFLACLRCDGVPRSSSQ